MGTRASSALGCGGISYQAEGPYNSRVPLAEALSNPGKLVPARVAEVLVAFGDSAVKPLIDELKYAGKEGQPLICEVLGQIGDTRAVPVLKEILRESPYEQGRAAAAQALGGIPEKGNVAALLEALGDPAWEVRGCAARALGELGGQEAAAGLAKAREDENRRVRVIAEAALKKLSSLADS